VLFPSVHLHDLVMRKRCYTRHVMYQFDKLTLNDERVQLANTTKEQELY
jgi:hypothetical protein